LFGLDSDTNAAAIIRAVMEGVAFGLRDGLDTLNLQLDDIAVIGGGAQSAYWAQLLCDALQVPLTVRDGAATCPALGAARLAMIAVSSASISDVCTQPPMVARYEPGAAPQARLALFRQLYVSLQPHFKDLP
jgi:xylulokinase